MACAAGGGERVSAPPEAVVHVDLPTFAALTPADLPTLERHLRSSQRWEIRLESAAAHELRLAMRRQAVTDDQGRVQYPSGSNGFYSNFQAQDIYQTRVLLGLNGEYGLGNARVGVTRATARAGDVQLELVQGDQPGLWSELIVAGGAGLTLEIYEQSRTGARPATTADTIAIG